MANKSLSAVLVDPTIAVINILERKGILTKDEVNEEIKKIRENEED